MLCFLLINISSNSKQPTCHSYCSVGHAFDSIYCVVDLRHGINHMIRFMYLCVYIGQESCRELWRNIYHFFFYTSIAIYSPWIRTLTVQTFASTVCPVPCVWSVSVYVTDPTYQKLKLIYLFSSWPFFFLYIKAVGRCMEPGITALFSLKLKHFQLQ